MAERAIPLTNTQPEGGGNSSRPRFGLLGEIWVLSKPRITGMVGVATAVGYLLAAKGAVDWNHLALVLLATLVLGGGNNALNQYMERETDRLMARTLSRPLPAGRLEPGSVLVGGGIACLLGMALLFLWAGWLAALVGLAVTVTYLLCYTPLKRISGLNTLAGAIPGALPPVLGWAAATGGVGQEALALFILLFVWQPPHFLAIAYLYRDQYARAGMPMLTVVDPTGAARRQMIVYSATLVPASLYPTTIGMAGPLYFFGALALSLVFLGTAGVMVWRTTATTARLMLKVSVFYLPLIFGLLLYDATG